MRYLRVGWGGAGPGTVRGRWSWTARRAALALLAFFATPLMAADFPEEELMERVRALAGDYFAGFQDPETGVLYGARLAGRASWTKPGDVLKELPHPWGYGSRIADTALHTGHMLVALLDAFEARPEPWLREQIGKHLAALKLIGSLPETRPKAGKPALVGLVPRGPHPDDLSAWYDDSSMDQHTTYIIALARYATSDVASAPERRWIADSLGKVGRRLERNGWRILRGDGVTEAHVGFSWLGMNSNHASILLPVVRALYAGTGDAHWKELYEDFLGEKEGKRWDLMHPGEHVRINGHPIYANQNAFRLNAYWRFEEDPSRREVIAALMEQSTALQLGRDFPGEMFRKFQPEEKWERLREACGWKDTQLHGAAEAWGMFRPEFLSGEEGGLAALAHVRFPLGGFHMALLCEDEETREKVEGEAWKMLSTVNLEEIDAGETHYLFTVVGLHLWARVLGEGDSTAEGAEKGSHGEDRESTSEVSIANAIDLEIAREAGTGPVMDVVARGERAWAIGEGKLYSLDIAQRGEPRVTGELGGLGSVRQLVVSGKVAYVTAREDGLFVVDVSDPEAPMLLDHYDTIEFATGVAISGEVLFVACRHFGVELVDVRNPREPVHLSAVRTGEAQSVTVRDGYMYAGVWASREVVVADVRDPRRPVITARAPLQGYGDGVEVVGDYLYAATGHHSRQEVRPKGKGDPGYGEGHGLEIFSIEDPAKPVFLSRVEFPVFYFIGNDTWRVKVAGRKAFVADTHNGMFVVDVGDPKAPVIESRCVLPYLKDRKVAGFVAGLWPVEDHVYVAGGWTDLHVIELPGVAVPPVVQKDAAPVIGERGEDAGIAGSRVYRPAGQIHGVELLPGGRAVVACGSAGVHVVDLGGEKPVMVEQLETEGFATDVAVTGDRVLVAEGTGGLSVCKMTKAGALRRIGRYRGTRAVRQVEVTGDYALIVEGAGSIRLIGLEDPAEPKVVMEDHQMGLLYGDQLMRGVVEGRYAAAFWHVSGVHWYDLEAKPAPEHSGDNWEARIGAMNGLAAMGERTLATVYGGYVLVERSERRAKEQVEVRRIGTGRGNPGKPTVFGDRFYGAERSSGVVMIADISDVENPVLLEQFETEGNPGRIAVNEAWVAIPDGYGGLLVLDR